MQAGLKTAGWDAEGVEEQSRGRVMCEPDLRDPTPLFLQGVHYGIFPGQSSFSGRMLTIWNALRPFNWWVNCKL